MSRSAKHGLHGLALVGTLSLTACQMIEPVASGLGRMAGAVSAGELPIAGASVQLYTVGVSGDGSVVGQPLIKKDGNDEQRWIV